MAGHCRVLVCLAVLILGANPTGAFGFYYCSYPSTASLYYYYPGYSYFTPYYYYPSGVRIIPLEESPRAIPVPAGPSSTPEKKGTMPPARVLNLDAGAPKIIATRSAGGIYSAGPTERCRVGFWNLSGRELTLTVEGKSWQLPKDQSVTLDVDRTFAWHVDQRAQQVERVPDGHSAHELLIRD